jgi:2,3-bisphosphoglycerate-independent phosphoglycerate mutase
VDPSPHRILLLFLDGVGLGDDDPEVNAFSVACLPTLRSMLGGGSLTRGVDGRAGSGEARVVAADVRLGIDGRPQSGTGQTALLTGINAAAIFGRHFGPWVPTDLRDLLRRENVLSRAVDAGLDVAFANAYPAGYLGTDGRGRRRPAAPPLAAEAAGVLNRDEIALAGGRAVASSIVNQGWRRHLGARVPEITPEAAGRNLARIAREARLTLFAHYDTDLVGHRSDLGQAVIALERVDRFLAGILADLASDTLLLVASDHGNLEDATTGHTLNPVPVVALGPGRDLVADRVREITDVAPTILAMLGAAADAEPPAASLRV